MRFLLYQAFAVLACCLVVGICQGTEVSKSPKIVDQAEKLNHPEGTNATFMCSIGSGELDGLAYEWLKDDKRLAPSPRHRISIAPENFNSILRVINLKPADSGLYACVAKNAFGKDRITINLNVKVQLKWVVEPEGSLEVQVGKPLHVPCVADGQPMPRVEWTKIDGGAGSASHSLGSELRFSAVAPADTGIYECRAKNGAEEDLAARVRIQVLDLLYFPTVSAFNHSERVQLRSEAKQMFYHAYHSYINTYPADEVLPISCRGRFRQVDDTSEIDNAIGNFSLTLVDSLDMLVMVGDIDEFQLAIKKIIRDLNFDMDMIVSVFETNIRMLGGLLSAHVLAKSLQNPHDKSIRYLNATHRDQMSWYNSELLDLAEDLGRRLLPAFDTKTGIPHSRVNLKYGLESNQLRSALETCTACAGSLILEFATLSRLTGDTIYEEKARGALDALWNYRHRSTDLVGTVINVETGDWVRRESGVGAGSDSYYEYLMKAYILLGDPTYLHRFNRHYSSVMRYISRGPFLIDVHMHRPNRIAKGFMDALTAFWPGLQVLKGDLKAAISTHAMFNEVIRRHSYLPEAFTTDLQVYWANHQMRPEFLESTFFLHRATREDYYLETGKEILRKLQDLKVGCGFAGLKDVRTGVHDDRMSSFVLAETLKYLYLLFSEDNETHVDLDKFIFSTEGHLLPIELSLSGKHNNLSEDNEPSKKTRVSRDELFGNPSDYDVKLVPWREKLSSDYKKIGKDAIIHVDRTTGTLSILQGSKQKFKVADLPLKISDNLSRESSVINLNDYDNSCPSLEVQEMRFDGRYHPFLNKRIRPTKSTTTLTNTVDPELLFAIGFKVLYSMAQ